MSTIHYNEQLPGASLRDHVACYWTFRVEAGREEPYRHHVMPDGCVSLVYTRVRERRIGPLILMGPRAEELRLDVQPGWASWGVRFRPEAGAASLGADGAELFDFVGPAAAHAPQLAHVLQARLDACSTRQEGLAVFDEVLPDYAPAALDDLVREAVAAIVAKDGSEGIADLAGRLAISERQLLRRFRRAVGLTPKQFARIRRFRAAVANVLREEPEAWGRVAAEQGFADQAHLVREFGQLVGWSPSVFEEQVRAIRHGRVDP